MSFFMKADLDELLVAAGRLQALDSSTAERNAAARSVTTAIRPPAYDEVSALVSRFFIDQARQYHNHAARAAVSQQKFVRSLRTGSFAYRDTETDIVNDFGIF